MTTGSLIAHGPELMTPRARAYLAIASARHLIIGTWCIVAPQSFRSPSYRGIKDALPVPATWAIIAWGALFVLTGILCAAAAVRGSEGIARHALLASVVTSGLWAGGFIATALVGQAAGPTGPVIWTALVLKDVTMLRQPLRNPFEPVARRILATKQG